MNLNAFYSAAKSGIDAQNKELPPVHLWDPESCGDIDIHIDRDGNWFHEGSRITRQPLIDLFSTILKREGDEHFLVTPQEKCRIKVDVAPLLITQWELSQAESPEQVIEFRTQQDSLVALNMEHALTLCRVNNEDYPIVHIRHGLHALVARNVYYQLAEFVEEFDRKKLADMQLYGDVQSDHILGLRSHGVVFALSTPH